MAEFNSDNELENELVLRDLYYSPKTGYRSTQHLYDLAKDENPSITKKFVKEWLKHQDSYTKHKKYNSPQFFRKTFVRDIGQVQVDLVFMLSHKTENSGYQYILMAIEILSRYGFTIPLKNKDGKSTLEAFKIFLKQFKDHFHKKPTVIQWDEGGEFLNKNMKDFLESQDIVQLSTNSQRKATIVERFNRTIKEKMQKMFERENNHIWYSKIDDLVQNYNSQNHRSIKMRPSEVDEDNKWVVWGRLFGHIVKFDKPRYKVGDKVRLLLFDPRYKGKKFLKAYREKHPPRHKPSGVIVQDQAIHAKGQAPFSNEIFRIDQVLIGDPVVYKLYSEEFDIEILGKFYESELSLVR